MSDTDKYACMSDERLAGLHTDRGWDGEEADALGVVAQRWVPPKHHEQYLDPIGLLVNELLDALTAERAALTAANARADEAEAALFIAGRIALDCDEVECDQRTCPEYDARTPRILHADKTCPIPEWVSDRKAAAREAVKR